MFGKLSATYDQNKTGCGLGLTICKQILERMNGSIDLQSEKGVGTTVRISIPKQFLKEKPFNIDEDET